MRVDLTDGQWVDLAELSEIVDGDRKAVNSTIRIIVTDDGEAIMGGDYEDRMRDALLKRIILNWSLPLPLPGDKGSDSLDRLTIQQARELKEATKEHFALINEGAGPGKDRKAPPTSA